MGEAFSQKVRSLFTTTTYEVDQETATTLFAYDDKSLARTFLTADDTNKEKSLHIGNANGKTIFHICVDGGLIAYGQEDYVGDGTTRGRFDCMIFDNDQLLLVEFKMDIDPTTADKSRWKNFSKAMRQIKDFYLHLNKCFALSENPLQEFYTDDRIIPIICMKHPPSIDLIRNVQRNTEKEKFRTQTGLKVNLLTRFDF